MIKDSFVGKAGHLVVMGEFLLRGYNVAMPEVDVGDDILVVSNWAEQLWRIQVKTAIGVKRSYGSSGQFLVSLKQLKEARSTALFYVFTLRWNGHWEFVVIPQEELYAAYVDNQVGSRSGENLALYFAFKRPELICGTRDFQHYRNNWDRWPIIEPG
jgi:hypothetical protein